MSDEFKEIKIYAGLILGCGGLVGIGLLIFWHGPVLASIALMALTLTAWIMAGKMILEVADRTVSLVLKLYWGFKLPPTQYDEEKRKVRAIGQRGGSYQIVEHAAVPDSVTTLHQTVAPRITEQSRPALPAPEKSSEATITPLPMSRTIYEVAGDMALRDEVFFGFSQEGPIWLEFKDLLSVGMIGNSRRGKSNALLCVVIGLLMKRVRIPGLDVCIFDGKGDLYKWLSAYHSVAYTPAEVEQMARGGLQEFARRQEEDRLNPGKKFPPIIFVFDEVDLLTARCKVVLDLIVALVKKAAYVNMHCLLANQSLEAELLGGVKNRGVVVSRVAFYCEAEAARMFGVTAASGAANLLQRIGPPAPAGLSVARTVVFAWQLIAWPYIPETAIPFLLSGLPPLPPLPIKQQEEPTYVDPAFAGPVYPSLSLEPTQPTTPPTPIAVFSPRERERERIIDAIKAHPHASASAIKQLLGYGDNNKVSLIKTLKEELIAAGELASKEE